MSSVSLEKIGIRQEKIGYECKFPEVTFSTSFAHREDTFSCTRQKAKICFSPCEKAGSCAQMQNGAL